LVRDRRPGPVRRGQLKGIVGLELPIARIEGKWKASQNRPERDRAGVVAGLDAEGDEATKAMARLVEAGGGAR
jgi:transcriptional regulator